VIHSASIVADGRRRLSRNEIERLRADLLARHAAKLQVSSWPRRLFMKLRIAAKARREARKSAPSPDCLYQRTP
jgi:hypothetical protein